MTDMYDKPKNYEGGKMKPYPHFEMPAFSGRASDPVAHLQAVEQRARERQVAYETVKLLRQKVIHCYRKEGVNHYENCRKETQALYDVISQKDVGQLQPNWSDPKMNDGW